MLSRGFLALVTIIVLVGCTSHNTESSTSASTVATEPAKVLTPEELVAKGRKVFVANCLSCHGGDPKVDGPVGPAIAGSSAELIHDRVLTLKYPDGYKPKRTTAMMVAFPQLEKDLPALTAYLQAP